MIEMIKKLCERKDLSAGEAGAAMEAIMDHEATAAQVAAFMIALKMKGETASEICGCAAVMRRRSLQVKSVRRGLTDTCGTGGDGLGTFNISTAAALVASAAGLPVAKHGNRAVSGHCGSADVWDALGVKLDLTPEDMGKCLDQTGLAFLYAPALHIAFKYAAGIRQEIGVRSIFNLLGPLTNPAGAKRQLLGVYAAELAEVMAEVLQILESEQALVVHGTDNSDELTLAGETLVYEVRGNTRRRYTVSPEEVGLARAEVRCLIGGGPQENAGIILSVLSGVKGPRLDAVLLNAGAALYVGGLADGIKEGVSMARQAVQCGAALEKLEALRRFSGGVKNA